MGGSKPAETDMELSVDEKKENLKSIRAAATGARNRGAYSVMATGNDSSTGAINQHVTLEQREDAEEIIKKANPNRMGTKGTNKGGNGIHISKGGFVTGVYEAWTGKGSGPSKN